MNNNQAGKGDKPRPTDKKTYNANYDEITWKEQQASLQSTTKKGKTTYKY